MQRKKYSLCASYSLYFWSSVIYFPLLSMSGRETTGSVVNFSGRKTRASGSVVKCPDKKSPECTPLISIDVTPGVFVRTFESGSRRNLLSGSEVELLVLFLDVYLATCH